MLNLAGSREGEICDAKRYILSNSANVGQPHVIQAHSHVRSQLLFPTNGNIKVTVNGKCWCLSTRNAIWIQSGALHEIYAEGAIEYRSVYIDPEIAQSIPLSSGSVEIKPLVKELINESASFDNTYPLNSPESRLNDVLFDQLKRMQKDTCSVLMPTNLKLSRLCKHVLNDPTDIVSLAEWGKKCGASERNMARLFKKQTGVSYTQWCHRVRISHAIERLKAGDSITTVSFNLGYSSCSAFAAMFKRIYGLPPSVYMNEYV